MTKPIDRPEHIYNVTATQFSLTRYYGGCKVNGVDYHYDPESDMLIRMDVWKARCAISKEAALKAIADEREKWIMVQQAFTEF